MLTTLWPILLTLMLLIGALAAIFTGDWRWLLLCLPGLLIFRAALRKG